MNNRRAAARTGPPPSPQPMETTMNRILEVTDDYETLALEFVDLEDLKNERILPTNLGSTFIPLDEKA
jgi:hypothetical protein